MNHSRVNAAIGVMTAVVLSLSACSSADDEQAAAQPSSAVLTEHDLDGKSTEQIIEELDKGADDKTAQLVGSVRYDELQLTDQESGEELTLPMDDEFYLAIAPYVEKTHECYYHNLASCQGELVDQQLDVTITADDGEVLVDETVTTYQNGFVGFWLPRDIAGTISVSYDGKSVEAPFATGADDPTCVTTLQLS